jgi:hypothetical protein
MDKTIFQLIFMIGIILISCDKGVKIPESLSPIVETDLPETGNIGEEIIITVKHGVYNGCGYYSSQKTIKDGNTLFVTFYAKYGESVCPMNAPILETPYKFTPNTSGTYTFKFNRGEVDNDLTQTIIIN